MRLALSWFPSLGYTAHDKPAIETPCLNKRESPCKAIRPVIGSSPRGLHGPPQDSQPEAPSLNGAGYPLLAPVACTHHDRMPRWLSHKRSQHHLAGENPFPLPPPAPAGCVQHTPPERKKNPPRKARTSADDSGPPRKTIETPGDRDRGDGPPRPRPSRGGKTERSFRDARDTRRSGRPAPERARQRRTSAA